MTTLDDYRRRIDALDTALVHTLSERFAVCRDIARFKREQLIPMMQSGRVDEVKRRCAEMGAANGVNPELVMEIYRLIIAESCRTEDEIIGVVDTEGSAAERRLHHDPQVHSQEPA